MLSGHRPSGELPHYTCWSLISRELRTSAKLGLHTATNGICQLIL